MKFPSWHHRAGKDQKMSVRVSIQGGKMPSGRALLISLCHCLLHLTVDQVYFGFFLIYFKINKYEHLALKNISFYEIDDFSFLSFFEKKKVLARVDKLHLGDSCVGFLYGEIITFWRGIHLYLQVNVTITNAPLFYFRRRVLSFKFQTYIKSA